MLRGLRALQPFHDAEPAVHPLAVLASLSNIDKHRVLPCRRDITGHQSVHDLEFGRRPLED
jgi:hypothetical protein